MGARRGTGRRKVGRKSAPDALQDPASKVTDVRGQESGPMSRHRRDGSHLTSRPTAFYI